MVDLLDADLRPSEQDSRIFRSLSTKVTSIDTSTITSIQQNDSAFSSHYLSNYPPPPHRQNIPSNKTIHSLQVIKISSYALHSPCKPSSPLKKPTPAHPLTTTRYVSERASEVTRANVQQSLSTFRHRVKQLHDSSKEAVERGKKKE